MQTFDFSPFYRSTVGFDRLFSRLDNLGDNAYRISIAVAGFASGDIAIESKENGLTIKGAKTADADEQKREFLHRGIAERAFELRFQLAEYVEVTGASLQNGLLHIDLKRELPEALKPRTVAIGMRPSTVSNS